MRAYSADPSWANRQACARAAVYLDRVEAGR
jgi:hypothetical protein